MSIRNVILTTGLVVLLFACSKNYFQQTSLSPAWQTATRYRTLVVKPVLVSSRPVSGEEVVNRCTFHLRTELSKRNLDLLSSDGFEETLRARSFGGSGTVSEKTMLEAARSQGAQVLVLTEISTESLQGGLPLMATLRMLQTSDGMQLYAGKARADNPASLEAGLEFALEKALEALK